MVHNDHNGRESKKRKKHFSNANKTRRLKQYLMGTIFLILIPFGWFYPLIGYFIPLCMLAGIGIASLKGRTWCNWICPRGSFSDSYMKNISPERKIPIYFKSLPLRIGVIIFLMSMLTYQCQVMARSIRCRQAVHDTPYHYDRHRRHSGNNYPSADVVLYLSDRNNSQLGR
jgi:hypothetical protein